jgi:hypothetical protein
MKAYGVELAEGSDIVNLTVAHGTSFPLTPNAGELFYRSDTQTLYVYTSTWEAVTGSAPANTVGYVHTQISSSNTWTVVHNLNTTNIQFSVYVDIASVQTATLPGSVVFVDVNTVEFGFSQTRTGRAILIGVF